MPRIVEFDHVSTYANEDLNIHHSDTGEVQAGVPTNIDITLHNKGDIDAPVYVRLYWCGPNAGAPAEAHTYIGGQLSPSVGPEGVSLTINKATSPTNTVVWTPQASILGAQARAHGCLFAQVQLRAIPPIYPDENHPDDWNPTSALNAQHNIELVQVAAGTKSVKFAVGVGQPTGKPLLTNVRVVPIVQKDEMLTRILNAKPFAVKAVRRGRVITASKAGLALGMERVVARENPLAQVTPQRGKKLALAQLHIAPTIRLGHLGLLSNVEAKAISATALAQKHKLELSPRELRQAIVEIQIPSGAKKNDFIGAEVIHETQPQVTRAGKRVASKLIGSVGVIVQII